jgi:hypothetical protein
MSGQTPERTRQLPTAARQTRWHGFCFSFGTATVIDLHSRPFWTADSPRCFDLDGNRRSLLSMCRGKFSQAIRYIQTSAVPKPDSLARRP